MKRTRSVLIMLMIVIATVGAALQNPLAAYAKSPATVANTINPFSGIDGRKCGGIQIHLTGKDKFDAKMKEKARKKE